MQLQGLDLTEMTGTWGESSHDCSPVVEGCRLLRKDTLGRQRGGVTLYVREQLNHMELCIGMGQESAESFWAKVIGHANVNAVVDLLIR